MKVVSRLLAFSFVAIGLVVADSGAGEKANPAAKPINRDVARHKQFLEIAKKGGVEVVFIGDSITQGWGNNAAWKKNFEPLKAANFGIGGDQTGHVLWRITDGHEIDKLNPKVAVIMIGTNNTGGHSAGQIAGGIKAIVARLREKQPQLHILLLGVFPRGEKPNPQREKLAAVNAAIAKLDDGKMVHYLDIGPKFMQADGTITKEIMPDYLHLSAKGYDIWAEAIDAKVAELMK